MLTVHKHHMLFFPNVFSPKKWFHCFMSMVRCTTFVVYGIQTWYGCSATTYVNCALFCLHIYVFSDRCYIQWPHYFAVLRYLTLATYITQWMLRWILAPLLLPQRGPAVQDHICSILCILPYEARILYESSSYLFCPSTRK